MPVACAKKTHREIAYKEITCSALRNRLKVSKPTVRVRANDHIQFSSRLPVTVTFEEASPFDDEILEFSIAPEDTIDKVVKSCVERLHAEAHGHGHAKCTFKYSVTAKGFSILDPQIIVDCEA